MMFHFSLLVKAKCSSNKRRQSLELKKKIPIIKNSRSGKKNVLMTSKQENSSLPCYVPSDKVLVDKMWWQN